MEELLSQRPANYVCLNKITVEKAMRKYFSVVHGYQRLE